MTNQQAPSEAWEKEFDEKFKDVWCSKISSFVPIPGGVRLAMHDFIRKVRAEAVEEALEKVVPEEKTEHCGSWEVDCGYCIKCQAMHDTDAPGWNACHAEVLRRVEAIKKELTDPK